LKAHYFKFQAPNSKHQTNSKTLKIKAQNSFGFCFSYFVFVWDLVLGNWCLEFGAWNLYNAYLFECISIIFLALHLPKTNSYGK